MLEGGNILGIILRDALHTLHICPGGEARQSLKSIAEIFWIMQRNFEYITTTLGVFRLVGFGSIAM
jgi:hypothetical protein